MSGSKVIQHLRLRVESLTSSLHLSSAQQPQLLQNLLEAPQPVLKQEHQDYEEHHRLANTEDAWGRGHGVLKSRRLLPGPCWTGHTCQSSQCWGAWLWEGSAVASVGVGSERPRNNRLQEVPDML